MDRRALLSRLGVAATVTTAGCGALDFGQSNETNGKSTVNPALEGTPTPAEVGDWSLDLGGLTYTAVYGDRLLTVQTSHERTRVAGFDPVSGERHYERLFDGAVEVPGFSTVLVLSGMEWLAFLDPQTGETLYRMDHSAVVASRPGETVLVSEGDDAWDPIRVVDTESWTDLHRYDTQSKLRTFGDGYAIFAKDESSRDRTVACYKTRTGEQLWERQLEHGDVLMNSTRFGDSILLGGRERLTSVAYATGKRRFTIKLETDYDPYWWLDDDDRVYLGPSVGGSSDEAGPVRAFDAREGLVWRREFESDATPLLKDGRLYAVQSEKDRTTRLDTETGEMRWQRDGGLLTAGLQGAYLRKQNRIASVTPEGDLRWQSQVSLLGRDSDLSGVEFLNDMLLFWTDHELVAVETGSGETTGVSGFESLENVAHHFDVDEEAVPTGRVFAVPSDSVVALSL